MQFPPLMFNPNGLFIAHGAYMPLQLHSWPQPHPWQQPHPLYHSIPVQAPPMPTYQPHAWAAWPHAHVLNSGLPHWSHPHQSVWATPQPPAPPPPLKRRPLPIPPPPRPPPPPQPDPKIFYFDKKAGAERKALMQAYPNHKLLFPDPSKHPDPRKDPNWKIPRAWAPQTWPDPNTGDETWSNPQISVYGGVSYQDADGNPGTIGYSLAQFVPCYSA